MTSSGDRFQELTEHIERLRDPEDGCPWDRAQDHRSLRPYMLEEAYEAVGAIDSGRSDALCDELGDVLLQVVLHAQIASEHGDFTIDDVVEGLIAKLIRRHPHVFGTASSELPEILRRWNDIKADENGYKTTLPPLVEARKFLQSCPFHAAGIPDIERDDAEATAGLQILRAVQACCLDGHEPEIALRKAVRAVRARVRECESG